MELSDVIRELKMLCKDGVVDNSFQADPRIQTDVVEVGQLKASGKERDVVNAR